MKTQTQVRLGALAALLLLGVSFKLHAQVPSGAVAWWRAENDALDTFGGHNGLLQNGATFAAGVDGQAFSFDGVNQYVEVASSPGVSFGSTSRMTVELWAYRIGSGTAMHLVGKRSGCGGDNSGINYQLAFNTVSGEGLNFGAGVGNEAASGLDLPLNTWTHLAGTFDGTSFRIYVNGDLKATQAGTLGPVNAAPLEIGGSGVCTNFAGLLDEVTLYDRALSGSEILAIHNAGASGKATDTPVITTLAALPDGKINTVYAQTLTASLGTPPYTFAPAGPMPDDLTLSSTGEIGGAPTFFGNASFTAEVTDAAGKSSTKTFSLYVPTYSGSAYTWNGGTADWSSAANWIPNGVPGPNDFATINGGLVYVSTDRSVAQLNLTGGTIAHNGTLTVNGEMNWTGGTMSGSGRTVIAPGAVLNLDTTAGANLGQYRTLDNAGTVNWRGSGALNLSDQSVMTNRTGAIFDVLNDAALRWAEPRLSTPFFYNAGTFRKRNSTGLTTIENPMRFYNYGTIEVQSGTLLNTTAYFYNYGTVTVAADAIMDSTGEHNLYDNAQLIGAGLHRISAGKMLAYLPASVTVQNLDFTGGVIDGNATLTVNGMMNWTGGTMNGSGHTVIALGAILTAGGAVPTTLTCNRPLDNSGTLDVLSGTLQLNSAYIQYAGRTSVCGGGNIANASPLQILAGEVRGSGIISGGVNNTGGTISPGCSPGQLTIGGSYTQGANGTLEIEVAGTTPGTTYDRLVIGGTATLAGTLRTTLANGFYPSANTNFMFLTAGSSSGSFAALYYPSNDVGEQVVYAANSASIKVINVRPNLPAITPQTIDEMALFTLPVGATDDDTPAQTLSYALLNAPAGATVNGSGAINWMPIEQQGPMTTNITVRVTDNGTPNLSVTNTFSVVVNEVNVAPALGTLSDQAVNPGQTLSFTATATDSDVPVNTLSFSLLNPPAGATITSGGLFNWRPGVALRDTTNAIQLRVQDNGAPVSNDTRSFSVIVNPLAAPVVLTPLGYDNGQFTLGVTGPLGPDYVIMGSTNLEQWSDLTTNLSPALPFQQTDPDAGSFSNRAYRVRLQP